MAFGARRSSALRRDVLCRQYCGEASSGLEATSGLADRARRDVAIILSKSKLGAAGQIFPQYDARPLCYRLILKTGCS
jgi:hypothetical protein